MGRLNCFGYRLFIVFVLSVFFGWLSPIAIIRVVPAPAPSPFSQFQPTQKVEAEQLFQQGLVQYQKNQLKAAIASWQKALLLYQRRQNRSRELMTLIRLSAAYLQLGDSQVAIAPAQAALNLAQTLKDTRAEVQALGNLAIAYGGVGHYPRSIELFEQALKLLQALPASTLQQQQLGQMLANLGNIYESLGEYNAAIDTYGRSLAIARATKNPSHESIILSNLGVVYAQQGNMDAAIRHYEQSRALAQQLGDTVGVGYTLNSLGTAYHSQQNRAQAIHYYEQSLAIAQATQTRNLEVVVLSNLGLVQEELGKYARAIALHQQGLKIAHTISDPLIQARARNNLGHSLMSAGRLAEAEAHLRQTIHVLEALRPGLGDTYKVSLFDTHVLSYTMLQEILVAQGKVGEALEVAERGRARAFVELLAGREKPSRSLPTYPEPLHLRQMQQIARAQNVTLVEYSVVPEYLWRVLGKLRGQASVLFIWVVQPNGNVTFRRVDLAALKTRQNLTLNQLVNRMRRTLYQSGRANVAARSTPGASLRPGDRVKQAGDPVHWEPYTVVKVDLEAGTVTLSHTEFLLPNPVVPIDTVYKVESAVTTPLETSSTTDLQELYQLLIAPISDQLPTNPDDRVVFIPQDQLFLVPFPALQDPKGTYLIDQHTISTAPVIEILSLSQRSQHQGPQRPLVVGNPSPMPGNLAPLPNAETEAQAVAELLQSTPIIGKAATETAIKQQLPTASLIHLATHGFFNEANPLEGAIALVPGDADQDGFLTAKEILNYSLTADLVVLSACDTGRGQITGDGVVGLSRSLMGAGARSVLVSLWQVPDRATAALMIEFYKQRQKTNHDAQALRQAMLLVRQRFPQPSDWAAFTLIR